MTIDQLQSALILDLGTVTGKTDADKAAVLAFLAKQGFKPGDVGVRAPEITTTTSESQGDDKRPSCRYFPSQTVQVIMTNVDRLSAATGHTG